MNRLHKDQKGVVFFTVLFIGLLLTFVGLSLADLVLVQFRRTVENTFISNALLTAEAGIERTVYAINETGSFVGLPVEEFYNNNEQGRGTFVTDVSPGSDDGERIITSTGRAYDKAGKLVKERRVRVSIVGTQSLLPNVYAGAGGLILSGGVNVANSDIYVEGFIELNNASSSIGSPTDIREIKARNVWCLNGVNYPEACPSSTQPITVHSNAEIYGHVCANNQTDGDRMFNASGGPGLDTGCPVLPVLNPYLYDRSDHIAAMNPSRVYSPSNNIVECGNGDETDWLDGTTITGTMTINSNSCDLTISGDVYIQGDLNLNKGTIQIADGLTERPVIVVDGKISTNNNLTILANDLGLGGRFISYKCRDLSNNLADGCEDIPDMALYYSRDELTVEAKSSDGAIGSIFHSYWGKSEIGASGNIASVVGQRVELSGNGAVVFGDTLSSETLSTWTIRSYQYDFD